MKNLFFSLLFFAIFSSQALDIGSYWKRVIKYESSLIEKLENIKAKIRSKHLHAQPLDNKHLFVEKVKQITHLWNMKPINIWIHNKNTGNDAFVTGNNIFLNQKNQPALTHNMSDEEKHLYDIETQFLAGHETAHRKNNDGIYNAKVILHSSLTSMLLFSLSIYKKNISNGVLAATILPVFSWIYLKYFVKPYQENRADLDALETFKCADCIEDLATIVPDSDENPKYLSYGYLSSEDILDHAQQLRHQGKHVPCQYHQNVQAGS